MRSQKLDWINQLERKFIKKELGIRRQKSEDEEVCQVEYCLKNIAQFILQLNY